MSSHLSLPLPPTFDYRRQVLTFVGRLLLTVAVLGVGYCTVARVGTLLNDREAAAVTSPDVLKASSVEPADASDAIMAAAIAGRWEFVEGGWMVGVGSMTDAGMPAFLSRPAAVVVTTGAVGDWERTVLELVQSFKLIGATLGTCRTYRFASPTLRAEIIVTAGTTQERLLAARAVFQTAPGQWSTIETERALESAARHSSAALLPYPERSELLAVRHDTADRVLGEFSRCETKINTLLKVWRDAGSPVTLKNAFDSADFSEGYCERHGRVLRVILWEPRSQGVTTILVLDASASEAPLPNSARTLVP